MGNQPSEEKEGIKHKVNNKTNEYLANERTFLAWIRTGIATISLGFVIARFSFWLREIAASTTGKNLNIPQTGLSLPMGLSMIAFGALMTLLAFFRYRAIQRAIDLDLPHPGAALIIFTTGAVVLLAVILIVYLLFASRQF